MGTARNRTVPSEDFTAPSGGRTAGSEEFVRDSVPVERFTPPTQIDRPDPRAWAERQMAEAAHRQFTPLGQVAHVIIGERLIDFRQSGPLLGLDAQKQLIFATPIFSLAPCKVCVDAKGKPIWNLEKMSAQARERVMKTATLKDMPMHLEAFAESGRYQGFYVLQPLKQIEFYTADCDRRRMLVNFWPSQDGAWPVLLYDAQAKRLYVWGGGGYQFG